jgi:erythromycin esterase
MKKLLLFILLLALGNDLFSQSSLNLDFETKVLQSTRPKKWWIAGNGYKIQLDSTVVHHGRYSLRIISENKPGNSFGVCTGSFPVEAAKGKEIVFKGWIKTDGVKNGYAGLWWRIDGGNKETLGFDNMNDRGLSGDTDWTAVSIKIKVSDKASNINFGAMFNGEGTAWFDDFEVIIDGKKYDEDLAAKTRTSLTKDELTWLQKNIIPLKSCDANSDSKDLEPLKKLVGDARIIGLGEVTHGSSEIFRMKHHLLKYLNESMDFDIFSIEASMPESYKVNNFVVGNKGNAKDLVKGMYFWTWKTDEVLNMVNWMNERNQSSTPKLKFTGFDMQFYRGAIDTLKTLTQGNQAEILKGLEEELNAVRAQSIKNKSFVSLTPVQKKFFDTELGKLDNWIKKNIRDTQEKNWALQNIRVIQQYIENSKWGLRDQYMAENLKWIYDQNRESKIVAWAHNGHIQKTKNRMGEYLSKEFGKKYINVGFAFYKGRYTAMGNAGLNTYEAEEAYPGTFEYFFNLTDQPIFLLDLRKIPRNDLTCKWIFEKLEFRQTGSAKMSNEFSETSITDDFDLIIFIRESSNSKSF